MSEQQPAPSPAPAPAGEGQASPQGRPGGPRRAERAGETARVLANAVMEGSPAVVTFLAIVAALVLGALLIAFTDTTVLHAWSQLFSHPGHAFAQAWDAISAAYSAMFDGAIFRPSTIGAAFHGGSVGALFYPISQSISH